MVSLALIVLALVLASLCLGRYPEAGLRNPLVGDEIERIATFYRQLLDGASPVLDDVTLATTRADLTTDRKSVV